MSFMKPLAGELCRKLPDPGPMQLLSKLLIYQSRKSLRSSTKMLKDDFLVNAAEQACVLDSHLRYAFFTHNKNAQTSINRKLLANRSIVQKDTPALWALACSQYDTLWDRVKAVCFTIVRNPYDRVGSAFRYLQENGKMSEGIGLSEFVEQTLAQDGVDFDPHFMPQEKYTKPIREMSFDFVISFESLKSGWRELACMIDAPEELPHSNYSGGDLALTRKARSIIEKTYARDFKGLGYIMRAI